MLSLCLPLIYFWMNFKSGITELSIQVAKLPGRKVLPIYIFNGALAYHFIIYLPLLCDIAIFKHFC